MYIQDFYELLVPGPANLNTQSTASSDPSVTKQQPDLKKTAGKKRRRPSEDWSVVVDVSDSEEEPAPKKRPVRLSLRRSTRGREKSVDSQSEKADENSSNEVKGKVIMKADDKMADSKLKIADDKPSTTESHDETNKIPSVLSGEEAEEQWTEKYAPRNATEVLGNTRCVERLRSWLQDWKEQTCREIRRIQQQQQQDNGEY